MTEKRFDKLSEQLEKTHPHIPFHQIKWVMGRVHVATSNLKVAKDMLKRTKSWNRDDRFVATRYALLCHEANSDLYNFVMK